jgi:1,4-alpha-glucan branching enzyme
METTGASRRRLPVGAELSESRVHFRVWAPRARRVELVLENDGHPVSLSPEPDGYYSCLIEAASAGTLYRSASTAIGCSPIQPRAFNQRVRMAPHAWSTPRCFSGRTAPGAGSACRAK